MKKLIVLLIVLTFIVSCTPRNRRGNHTSVRDRAPLRENSSLDTVKRDDTSYNKSYDVSKRNNKVKIRTGVKPAWVDGEDANYPSSRYLIARGIARVNNDDMKTRQAAEQALRAEMSQIFHTAITASNKTIKKAKAIRKDKKLVGNEVTFESEKVIKNDTKSRYFGMIIADYWKDSDGTIYVLGTIDKTVVVPLLVEKISDLDEIIDGLVRVVKESVDPIERGKLLNKAIDKSIMREYYVKQLMIMDGKVDRTPYTVDILADMIDQNLESMKVAVIVNGPAGKEFRNVILNIGTSIGLQVDVQDEDNAKSGANETFEDFGEDITRDSNYGKDADILIKANVSFKELERGDNHKWVVGKISIILINNNTNKIYKAFNISRREGAYSVDDAKRKALINLSKKVKRKLKERLKEAITGK